MDRRSWPWKKKSSDKAAVEKAVATLDSAAGASLPSVGSQGDQLEKYKKPNFVQISVEVYSHLTGLENQVKSYEDQVKTYEDQFQKLEDQIEELNEKLSEAQTEMTTKEGLVKQHAKVAEEAVSGWEKAEAEALSLKTHLETVTLAKLTAEDRASHLDGALKECMRQIRNLKEEHEQKLRDIVLTKTKQCDKIKLDFEARIASLDEELLRSEADNAALSRSLQDRSNMLINISEEKSQAEADIEHLKGNIDSCEREISSLKYELHLVSKELEIRNEEKNMSVRTAEVANKQHLEGAKKIAKLEAECQRLRGLVRKKLPGPAALAQMKIEVENMGRDYGDSRFRRSPVKPNSPYPSQLPEFSLDSIQKFHKDNEFLTERILAMEEETKMLKEALAKRNSELQASRNMCARTASRLQIIEAQIQNNNQNRSVSKVGGSPSQHASNPPSTTSVSEDGNEDAVSCAESWATTMISDRRSKKTENENQMELMDDFLEMEKLACLPETSNRDSLVEVTESNPSNTEASASVPESETNQLSLTKLQSTISSVFESISKDTDLGKVLEDINRVVQETHDSVLSTDGEAASEKASSAIRSPALATAISHMNDFVLLLGKEAMAVLGLSPDRGDGLGQRIEQFSITFSKVVNNEVSLDDLVLDFSTVLAKASELNFVLSYKAIEEETNNSDCIDKVALLENKVVQDDSTRERFSNGCGNISDSTSDPEIPHEGPLIPGYELNVTSCKCCSLAEFEQLKSDLARSVENLESMKLELQETEKLLTEAKSELASTQRLNGLAETQLKCMAESYKSLEKRAGELETEVELLRAKTETLSNELQEEKKGHEDALFKCKDLQEQLRRVESCSVCSLSAADDSDTKIKQERDIAAAAEKLAECQETIFLLGRQLKAMHPPNEHMGSPNSQRSQKGEGYTTEEEEVTNSRNTDHTELNNDGAVTPGSPPDLCIVPYSPSDAESNLLLRSPISSKHTKHRSGSSSSSSTPTPDKNQRGISRFFSSKTKSGY